MAKSWYVFLGTGDPTVASNYARITVKHDSLCGNEISVIYTEGEDFRPESPLSLNMQRYIKQALATGALQPASPSNAKKYVYLRHREP